MTQLHHRGVLQARPDTFTPAAAPEPGVHRLPVAARRAPSVLYVPPTCAAGRPGPLLLLLHGAGGYGEGMLSVFRQAADANATPVLAPTSDGVSWDIIGGGYGPDVRIIDEALRRTFESLAVDPGRLAIGGFSDGASYALALGIANGDLFSHVLAFSPGFLAASRGREAPRIFVSHGVGDRILPIERCSRRLVPRLEMDGHDLSYHEFEGGHDIPLEVLELGFRWFLGGAP